MGSYNTTMYIPRIKVNINLDEGRHDEYSSSPASYSRKPSPSASSSPTTSQSRHREHSRRHRSSYDYEDPPNTNYREKHSPSSYRDQPKLDRYYAQGVIREPSRPSTKDWEPTTRQQQVPARVTDYPSLKSLWENETRGLGPYVKSVERRMVAENLVEVIEVAPRGSSRRSSTRERRYTRYPERRLEPEREYAVKEPKGWGRRRF